VREDGVRNSGVWKAIYREGGSKKWLGGHKCSQKNVVKHVFLLDHRRNMWCKPSAMTLMQSGKYYPECTFFFGIYFPD